jgi:hypothetical protein
VGNSLRHGAGGRVNEGKVVAKTGGDSLGCCAARARVQEEGGRRRTGRVNQMGYLPSQ